MHSRNSILLIIVSGVFLVLSWEFEILCYLVFISLVPLFFLLNKNQAKWKSYLAFYLAMLIWNTLSLFGLYHTGVTFKITLLILLNSLISCVPFLYLLYKKVAIHHILFPVIFISLWLSIEYFHLHSDIGFPFLLLDLFDSEIQLFV
jgi:apolipoprotein N-acyltransferase